MASGRQYPIRDESNERNVLRLFVHTFHAVVEGLARIDVLCIDKTGTLITGRTTLDTLEPLGTTLEELQEALFAMAKCEQCPTTTMLTITPEVGEAPSWTRTAQVAFSSARKWSATSFGGHARS